VKTERLPVVQVQSSVGPDTPTATDSKSSNESDDGSTMQPQDGTKTVETAEIQTPREESSAMQLAPGWIMGPREPTEEEKAAIEEEKKRRASYDAARSRLGHDSPPKPVLAAGPFAAAQESSVHISPDVHVDHLLTLQVASDAVIFPTVPAGPFAAAQEASVLLPPNVYDVGEQEGSVGLSCSSLFTYLLVCLKLFKAFMSELMSNNKVTKLLQERVSIDRSVEHHEVLVDRLATLVSSEPSGGHILMGVHPPDQEIGKEGNLGAVENIALVAMPPSKCKEGDEKLQSVKHRKDPEVRNAPNNSTRSSTHNSVGERTEQRPTPASIFHTMPQNIVVPDSVVESVIAKLQFVRMTRGLNWIINRPILTCSIVVLVWTIIRGIWSLLPGEVQEFKSALLLSGGVALAATLLAYFVGGATLMPESESELVVDEGESLSTPMVEDSVVEPGLVHGGPLPTGNEMTGDDNKEDDILPHEKENPLSSMVENTMEALDPGMEMVGEVQEEGVGAGKAGAADSDNQEKEEGYSTDSDRPGPVIEGVHSVDKKT
jgi:hypothetical protein